MLDVDQVAGIVHLSEEETIPATWLPLFLLASQSKVPWEWVKALLDDDDLAGDLGEEARVKLEYTHV